MNFDYSEKTKDLIARLEAFMDEHIYPNEKQYLADVEAASTNPETRWKTLPLIEELKEKAKAAGLWNLFLPEEYLPYGAGLNNLEYAPLCEIMGRVMFSSEVFNCSAPDTGNMEVLARYGSQADKKKWLEPLLEGKIRSGFAMTEPAVASSDATNIETSITRDGDEYVINGRKWYTSGAMNEDCKILVVMGKTDPTAARHEQQSQILVPIDTKGVTVVRPLSGMGFYDEPIGHAEVLFEDVRVPASSLLVGEGKGFEIAQGRLGPGRIHHCMRLIGCAQRALDLACERVESRVAFGQPLSKQQSVRESIAKMHCEIEQARLLTLKAADKMDRYGNKVARDIIAAIKIVAPTMACNVIDQAIQMHGAAGTSQDFSLAASYAYARTIRLADGPDQVHMMQLGRNLIKDHNA
ncbi:MAG: acyl-CoA dehydrogenase [Alteromonadaceae bacterium]|jgi:acyl-CoA dehydrogenase|uniref:Acyl-CoA dehydrogenase n=2 Tax=Paraglaciecola chathamensis TaxID=368405 RepID=A0A8H9IHN6_9ALTE|nr:MULTISPECIES: acyl-CoA dehydrogenase family protein [Paraglaciecola]AEE22743.1 acyl-CoA dehydrogenase domain-containing protein [Glaciecola sp. 4H-3-7+YE-5]MBN25895.1 acyl-CoA dehydrogenase [Alteromonadaceae bacterium]MBJ2136819.1 acyl-CoA dehydrogenase family protein [Paraglaciecola chathamensis]MDO6558509.1 acyl-CoA dehydrogenase family protein [Paraglaciecola chathamensis]MDO6840647.1 acyl-CoA dehydrogenase family protein [Paraglaciecola chathamensis]|tara:strand:+ start:105863 stop:107089 length:1227 start_codon:yes stop_codon:yes gene_type:complete